MVRFLMGEVVLSMGPGLESLELQNRAQPVIDGALQTRR